MEVRTTHGVQFGSGSPVVRGSYSNGTIPMQRTNERHLSPGIQKSAGSDGDTPDFASLLGQALSSVEKMDASTQDLTSRAVYDPDSVDVHSIMIAAEKSRFALTLTKTLADGFVKTFKELTNPR